MNASLPGPAATFEATKLVASALALRILFVDDEESLRRVVPMALTRRGHSVVVASDGQEALALFQPGKFDLVLTDLTMPHLTGDKLAEAIKELDPAQPVILLTAESEAFLIKARKAESFDLLLDKPLTADELVAAIARVVQQPRSVQDLAKGV